MRDIIKDKIEDSRLRSDARRALRKKKFFLLRQRRLASARASIEQKLPSQRVSC